MDLELKAYFEKHIGGLQALVRIPSVYDAESVSADMPYGKGVAAALDYMRQLALSDGFEVLEYGGHAIAVRLGRQEDGQTAVVSHPGSQEDGQTVACRPGTQEDGQTAEACLPRPQEDGRIDVVSHLDVVEPGIGWSGDPFSGQIRGGRLYGRGTQDMKTSAYLTYLSLKRLKEENFPACGSLRLVYGCDEERTMDDMIYYVSRAGLPDFAFTPDGCFPMAIGEKGALMWRLSGPYQGPIRSMDCGVQCNVIPPVAKAVLEGGAADSLKARMQELGIDGSIEEKDGAVLVEVRGRAAHASKPEDGHSATVDLFALLREMDPLADNLYRCFADSYGRAWVEVPEGADTDFTVNLGVFRIRDGMCYGEVDGRYPFGLRAQELTERLAARCALQVSLDYDSAPMMNEKDDPYVAAMLRVYREKTGDLSEPVVSGGVSYSKIFGHCVAFGPVSADMKNLCHQADESIALTDCAKAFEIYYETMKQLALRQRKMAKTR